VVAVGSTRSTRSTRGPLDRLGTRASESVAWRRRTAQFPESV